MSYCLIVSWIRISFSLKSTSSITWISTSALFLLLLLYLSFPFMLVSIFKVSFCRLQKYGYCLLIHLAIISSYLLIGELLIVTLITESYVFIELITVSVCVTFIFLFHEQGK